jgi:nickel/cobalt transporter (NiCoT) family protein
MSSPSPDNVGHGVVGLFVVVRAAALASWRFAKVEERWAARAASGN